MDVSCLTDSMAAVLSLSVHGRVPVAVVEDDRVGSRQVHPDASATSRQDEAEDPTVGVEALHESLKEGRRRREKETFSIFVGFISFFF